MDFILNKDIDVNNISHTGARAIALIGLLLVAPRSMQEIREKFIEYGIMDSSQSDDIIRIDMNTIKSFGCEISRSSLKTQYKYVLTKHPFTINMTEDDIKLLKRLLDKIKNTVSIYKLLEFNAFFEKISKYISEDIKEKVLGISPLKYYEIDTINELAAACANNYTVKLMYKKTSAKNPAEKNIVAQKLIFQNDKLYLYGYDLEKQDSVTLLFNRITSVESKKLTDKFFVQKPLFVKFHLKNYDLNLLTEEEKCLGKSDNGYIVEGGYFNEFLAIQRILSFGAQCTVIEPIEFRRKIISKLKEMRKIYEKK